MEYCVLWSGDADKLADKVDKFLAEGWRLQVFSDSRPALGVCILIKPYAVRLYNIEKINADLY